MKNINGKHIYFVFMVILIFLFSSACTKSDENNIAIEKEPLTIRFSEYYQKAIDYEKIYPLLNKYFNCVQDAYDDSDRTDIATFILNEEYQSVAEELSELSNTHKEEILKITRNIYSLDINNEVINNNIATLKMFEQFLKVEMHLASREILFNSDNDSSDQWFDNLNIILECAYLEFEIGTGE